MDNKERLEEELSQQIKMREKLSRDKEVFDKLKNIEEDYERDIERIERYLSSRSISEDGYLFYASKKREMTKKMLDFEEVISSSRKLYDQKCEECDYNIKVINNRINELEDTEETDDEI